MKKPVFVSGEYYHIYNRGVDKRQIFLDGYDIDRFFQCMDEFNAINPIGSLYENIFLEPAGKVKRKNKKLVEFVAYCLNPNHYHFILQQLADGGISEFMKRLNGGYAWYFNNKNKRSGALFQGKFKAKHINTNEYLLRLSAYVNLNNFVHKLPLSGPTAKLVKSSWGEYLKNDGDMAFCNKKIVLSQFNSKNTFKDFAQDSLQDSLKRKEQEKEVADILLE